MESMSGSGPPPCSCVMNDTYTSVIMCSVSVCHTRCCMRAGDCVCFCSLLYLQGLEQCLAHNKSSITVCLINKYLMKELRILIDRKVNISSVTRLPIKGADVQSGEGEILLHFSVNGMAYRNSFIFGCSQLLRNVGEVSETISAFRKRERGMISDYPKNSSIGWPHRE